MSWAKLRSIIDTKDGDDLVRLGDDPARGGYAGLGRIDILSGKGNDTFEIGSQTVGGINGTGDLTVVAGNGNKTLVAGTIDDLSVSFGNGDHNISVSSSDSLGITTGVGHQTILIGVVSGYLEILLSDGGSEITLGQVNAGTELSIHLARDGGADLLTFNQNPSSNIEVANFSMLDGDKLNVQDPNAWNFAGAYQSTFTFSDGATSFVLENVLGGTQDPLDYFI